jgi:hypothetical protein
MNLTFFLERRLDEIRTRPLPRASVNEITGRLYRRLGRNVQEMLAG